MGLNTDTKNVAVIGAGASGLIAAAFSAKRGNNVTLIEQMPKPARKLMITGKGRCNITNACFDLNDLVSNVVTNGNFMYSAFSSFMPYDTIALMEELGVDIKTERGNRVFPQSDKASDVVDALVKFALDSGAVITRGRATGLNIADGVVTSVQLDDGRIIPCDSAAVCTGGKSYPATGSRGDGYMLAESAGHTIVEPRPALVGLVCSNNFISALQGLSLKNVAIKVKEGGKTVYSDFGEMLFTHFGVSGPVILSASSFLENPGKHNYTLVIDLKPALDENKLYKRIHRDFEENNNKDFINSLNSLLPKKLVPVIAGQSGIKPSEKCNSVTRNERLSLVHLLKNFEIDITSFRPIEEAIVTSGGVSVKEIEPASMRSRIVPNLYFAGEVIDVDALTGGFNLQIAFSTGYVCAMNF